MLVFCPYADSPSTWLPKLRRADFVSPDRAWAWKKYLASFDSFLRAGLLRAKVPLLHRARKANAMVFPGRHSFVAGVVRSLVGLWGRVGGVVGWVVGLGRVWGGEGVWVRCGWVGWACSAQPTIGTTWTMHT